MPAPDWKQWLNEQTPAALKVDKEGMRALGYKKFKLGRLLEFARKTKTRVTISPPYVSLEALENALEEEETDSVPWPEHTRNQPMLHRRTLIKLEKEVGETKLQHCKSVMNLMDIPPQKVAVRCVTSLGKRHPVALVFRINDCPLKHDVLKNIYECPWVKACYVQIIETIVQLKVVVS